MRQLVLAAVCAGAAFAQTQYEIDLRNAAARDLAVTLETECVKADCDFQMPVWNATYQIRDFAQYVSRFEAAGGDGARLGHRLVTTSLWRVTARPGQRVRVRYHYFADSTSPFGCAATGRHVFLNFAQILVYPVGRRREPMTVQFREKPAEWKIALELPERGGAFQARNYDELADAPAELSAFAEASFRLGGKRLRIVVDAAPQDYDLQRIENAAQKIAATAVDIMHDAPFPGYTFIYHLRPGGGGGMEHTNSTAIDSRAPCKECTLASVTAHEFFHLWNVKRIRPQSLEPIDYTRENITPSLWFSEGVTSTYGSYILLQAGLEDSAAFLRRLAGQITRYERVPAHMAQSAEESSISAWLERYPYYSQPSRSVSYYLKGELAGYLLDLAIRYYSENRRSLDDLMRRLNTDYAQQGKFFEDTEALERLASKLAGHDVKAFFDAVIRGTEPIPWDRYFRYAGYRLTSKTSCVASLGIEMARAPGRGVAVAEVAPDGAGERAGVQAGDRVVALDGRPVERNLEDALGALNLKPRSKVNVEIERQGQRRTVTAVPDWVERLVYRIEPEPHASREEKALGASWLRTR
jgi:predicted metalloprotease with PDZ domain